MSNQTKIIINHVRPSKVFTNHDTVSGKLVLDVVSDLSVSSIIVKLEGVSKTVVVGKRKSNRNGKIEYATEIESHKVLYKSLKVFPPKELLSAASSNSDPASPLTSNYAATESGTFDRGFFGSNGNNNSNTNNNSSSSSTAPEKEYTLSPGHYEYDFEFTIPLKNHCVIDLQGITNKYSFGVTGINTINKNQELIKHVSNPLPPSLPKVSFENKSQVEYYVKATIRRSSFYKQNIRVIEPFRFVPLDFSYTGAAPESAPKISFTRKEFSVSRKIAGSAVPLQFYFELRYNYPGYINAANTTDPQTKPTLKFYFLTTANFPELIKYQTVTSDAKIIINALKVDLVSATTLLAEDLRQQIGSTINLLDESYLNLSNPSKVIDFASFKPSRGKNAKGEPLFEVEIPAQLYADKYTNLNSPHLIPDFKTCNIKRDYKLVTNLVFQVAEDPQGKLAATGDTSAVTTKPTSLVIENDFHVTSGLNIPGINLNSESNDHITNTQTQQATATAGTAGPFAAGTAASSSSGASSAGASSAGITAGGPPQAPPRPSKPHYEALAGDFSNKLASKINKLSMKVGEDNPKYASHVNKFSSFINKQNETLQQRLNRQQQEASAAAASSTASGHSTPNDSTTNLNDVSFHGDELAGAVPVVDTKPSSTTGTAATTSGNGLTAAQQAVASTAGRPSGAPPSSKANANADATNAATGAVSGVVASGVAAAGAAVTLGGNTSNTTNNNIINSNDYVEAGVAETGTYSNTDSTAAAAASSSSSSSSSQKRPSENKKQQAASFADYEEPHYNEPPPAYEEPDFDIAQAQAASSEVHNAPTSSTGAANVITNTPDASSTASSIPDPATHGALPNYPLGSNGVGFSNVPLDKYGYPVDRKDSHLGNLSTLNNDNSTATGTSASTNTTAPSFAGQAQAQDPPATSFPGVSGISSSSPTAANHSNNIDQNQNQNQNKNSAELPDYGQIPEDQRKPAPQ